MPLCKTKRKNELKNSCFLPKQSRFWLKMSIFAHNNLHFGIMSKQIDELIFEVRFQMVCY